MTKCPCAMCSPENVGSIMILCPTCGNKRCPHATDHRFACTGSNEPGQFGSSYGYHPSDVPPEPVVPDVAEMVNRFLGWKVPTDFSPDCGISFDGRKDDEWNKNKSWPIGTNLLSSDQAKAMFEHCLGTTHADREKLLRIIAYAYQVAGAHDAPERILDVLADPEAATDAQVEAMLPYHPEVDLAARVENLDIAINAVMEGVQSVAAYIGERCLNRANTVMQNVFDEARKEK